MTLAALGLTLLAVPLVAQTPRGPRIDPGPPTVTPSDAPKARVVDGIAAIVGDAAVTMSELDEAVRKSAERAQRPITTREEYDALAGRELVEMISIELEMQAGEDLAAVGANVDSLVQRDIEIDRRQGGVLKYADKLLAEGRSALTAVEDRRKRLYLELFRGNQLGWPGPDRIHVDNWTRPGQLQAIYRENRDDLNPPRARFQFLIMPVEFAGGVETAYELFEENLERLAAGEDFGDLVEEMGVQYVETRGVTDFRDLTPPLNPGLIEFGRRAQIGEVSDIMPLGPPEEPEALMLVRLFDREVTAPPPFEEPEIQDTLREQWGRVRQERRLFSAHDRLFEDAFLWLNPGLESLQEPMRQYRALRRR